MLTPRRPGLSPRRLALTTSTAYAHHLDGLDSHLDGWHSPPPRPGLSPRRLALTSSTPWTLTSMAGTHLLDGLCSPLHGWHSPPRRPGLSPRWLALTTLNSLDFRLDGLCSPLAGLYSLPHWLEFVPLAKAGTSPNHIPTRARRPLPSPPPLHQHSPLTKTPAIDASERPFLRISPETQSYVHTSYRQEFSFDVHQTIIAFTP